MSGLNCLNFYLAARYSRREELCEYKTDLEARGHKVPARWLLGEHQVHGVEAARAVEAGGPVPAPEARLFAEDDIADVLAADVLVAFTEPPRSNASRGGRHVEFGIGLGLRRAGLTVQSPTLLVVGPLENVFHALPEVDAAFDTWADLLAALDLVDARIHGWDFTGENRCHHHPWHGWTNWHRRDYPHPMAAYLRATAQDGAS